MADLEDDSDDYYTDDTDSDDDMADGNDDTIALTADSSKLGQDLSTLRNDDDLTDFSLKSGNKVVKCHSVVLAAGSPVLKAMLRTQMKEASQREMKLDIFSPQILDIVVEYLYTRNVRIEKDMLLELIEAADFLEMIKLRRKVV